MRRWLLVFITTPTRHQAQTIGRRLVQERLAACVQVFGPVTSSYRWQGRLERSREWLCLVKTERRRLDQVVALVKRLHSYQLPELIALPISAGSPDYLKWLGAELVAPRRTDG